MKTHYLSLAALAAAMVVPGQAQAKAGDVQVKLLATLVAPDGKLTRQFLGPVTAKVIEDAIAEAGGPSPGGA